MTCPAKVDAAPRGVPETSRQAAPERADLLLRSVGTATPAAAAVLTQALGLPREFVVDAIYRAPARLLANLPHDDAQQLARLLHQCGLDAAVVDAGTAVTRHPGLDVALTLTDHARADDVAQALARFIGTTAEAALDLILAPPGIVLGSVTQPTVDALQACLPPGAATLITSRPDTSRYALFAPQLTPAQRAALPPHASAHAPLGADGSLACFDLSKAEADQLWRRLGMPQQIRIVNQDFLRFTLVLTAAPGDAAAGAKALAELAAVPPSAYQELSGLLPCPLVDGIGYHDLPARMGALTEAGFAVRADLETFAAWALEIRHASAQALAAVGLTAPAPLVTAPMPVEQARLMRARLEALGAEVLPA